MCCVGHFFIPSCWFGRCWGKVEIFSKCSVKPCGDCRAVHTAARFCYRNKCSFPCCSPDAGPARNYLSCSVFRRKSLPVATVLVNFRATGNLLVMGLKTSSCSWFWKWIISLFLPDGFFCFCFFPFLHKLVLLDAWVFQAFCSLARLMTGIWNWWVGKELDLWWSKSEFFQPGQNFLIA